jgi:hypothetical protein
MNKFVIAVLFSCAIIANAKSQDVVDSSQNKIVFNGFARGSVYAGSETYDISNAYGEFGINTSYSNGNANIKADFRVREGVFFGQRKTIIDLKEVYASYNSTKFSLSLGNQIVQWGRSTGFNPTNNICPKDYFFLSSDFDDMNMSNFMLRTQIQLFNSTNLEIIGIPFYRPSIYRYDLFDMGEGVSFAENELPSYTIKNSSVAARINTELSKIDFSVSYFHGYDPFYGFDVKSVNFVPSLSIVNQAVFYQKDAIGLDFAIPIQSWLLRTEASYNITKNYEENIFTPNPDFYYVVGLEKSVFDITCIFEFIGKYTLDYSNPTRPFTPDFQDPLAVMQYANDMIFYESEIYNRKIFNQQEEINYAFMLTLSRSFYYEALNADLSLYYNLTSNEKIVRGGVKWKISDELSVAVGGQYLTGSESTIYYKAGKIMNGGYGALTYKF